MPNYCDNVITITGTKEDISKVNEMCFTTKASEYSKPGVINLETSIDFEKILPTPKHPNGEIIDDWYEWRLKNWGTKWNSNTLSFSIKIIDENTTELTTAFTTAWCPPDKLYKYLVDKLADIPVTFRADYYEGGCAFAGHIEFGSGEIIEEKYVEWISKDMANNINYYTYIIENQHECLDYLEEQIGEHTDDESIGEKFLNLCKEKNYIEAATLYLQVTQEY